MQNFKDVNWLIIKNLKSYSPVRVIENLTKIAQDICQYVQNLTNLGMLSTQKYILRLVILYGRIYQTDQNSPCLT